MPVRGGSPPRRTGAFGGKISKKEVDSKIYQEDYYLKAFNGQVKQYLESLKSGVLDNRCKEIFLLAQLKTGERILDVGCGRGELLYFSLLKGASKAVGVDFSQAALSIARKAIEALPKDLKTRAKLLYQNISSLKLEGKFDCCFLIDLVEHLTDNQLYKLFSEIKNHLSSQGRIIIHTAPNINWIRFEYPLKRFLVIPSTIIKRLTGKKPYSSSLHTNFLKKIFSYLDLCYARDYYSYSPKMHINEQSPTSLRRLLKSLNFDFKVWCEDGSSNVISIICKKFWGPDIWAIARLKKSCNDI
jgi:SAM-dependent methyltransferase